jgi:acyl transferase domain-containing protein/aryl carrier-like protein
MTLVPWPRARVLTFSAPSPAELEALAGAFATLFEREPAPNVDDVCHTAAQEHGAGEHRLAAAFQSREGLVESLRSFTYAEECEAVSSGALSAAPVRIAFVFSGEGTQWPGMGRALMECAPAARAVLERCDELLRTHVEWSLLEELTATERDSRLTATAIAQPAIFAVQVALAAAWSSWGIEPDAVLGHSLGEIAAAHVAGVLSLEHALLATVEQGRLLENAGGLGRMLAVGLPQDDARALVEGREQRICVAGVNGVRSTVLSGDAEAIEEVVALLSQRGVFNKVLALDYAFHSPHMDPFCDRLEQALTALDPHPASVPIRPTIEIPEDQRAFGGGYWARMVREPVMFAPAVDALIDEGIDVFVELGPSPALSTPIAQCLEHRGVGGAVLGSLRAGDHELTTMAGTLAALHVRGRPVDWGALQPHGRRIDLRVGAAPTGRLRRSQSPSADGDSTPAPLLEVVFAAAPAGRLDAIVEHVHRRVLEVCDDIGTGRLDLDAGLFDIGLGSLTAVKLASRLREDVGSQADLPSTLAFDYPTIAAIAAFIADQLDLDGELSSPTNPSPASRRVARPSGRLDATSAEPIAVIGMGCRYPGAFDGPEAFWRVLSEGIDATAEIPAERWDTQGLYDPDPSCAGKIYARRGGFIDSVDTFDAEFFGISPREAQSMDPQQRLLLEVAWEALEDAGLAPAGLLNTATGVFAGIGIDDYKMLQTGEPAAIDGYTGTGHLFCVAAGRLSYVLGLQGPSMAVDTGCSSSLVTVHLACQSLRVGECDAALAGGVHLMLSPEVTLFLSRAGALAPDGRCKTFDASADGYSRAEGCGMLVLKRLADATAAGDNVLAVLHGSAVNHDGPSSGLTVPNGRSQQALIERALAVAGVGPQEIDYVEAHGTGTPLGDPIELHALSATFGGERSLERPLLVGSAKTNIGHLESAAGVAGLTKVILALSHESIPPHLHLREPTARVDWSQMPLEVPVTARPWRRGARRRLAGVSSFGIGGTNAHVVVGEAPTASRGAQPQTAPVELVVLSARTDDALDELVERYTRHVERNPDTCLADLAYTASVGRSHFTRRMAITARTPSELGEELTARAAAGPTSDAGRTARPSKRRPRVAFMFTGQGSQYAGMGAGLYATQPVFRAAIDHCEQLLASELELPLRAVMHPTGGAATPLEQTAYTQPALFALEYALAKLWKSWGITPSLVLGHSVGEYVAAVVAGILPLESALRLVSLRGRLMQALPSTGKMAAIFACESEVEELLAPYAEQASVAAVNSDTETVVSGEAEAVDAVISSFALRGVQTRELHVSHAFHSPLMAPMLGQFERAVAALQPDRPQIDVISTVSGELIAAGDMTSPAYWSANVRSSVRFMDAISALQRRGCDAVVELGPAPALSGIVRRAQLDRGDGGRVWVGSLRRGQDDREQMLTSLGRLYTSGVEVDWQGVYRGRSARKTKLPTYPFQRRRHWRDTRGRAAPAQPASASVQPSLVGRRVRSPALADELFEMRFDAHGPAFVTEHTLFDTAVIAAATQLSMTLAAAAATGLVLPCALEDVTFPAPLTIGEEARVVQVILGRGPERAFRLVSAPDGAQTWSEHASGAIAADPPVPAQRELLAALRERAEAELDSVAFHAPLEAAGYRVGPSFRWIQSIASTGPGEVLARLEIPAGDSAPDAQTLSPGLLDSCLRSALATLEPGACTSGEDLFVPVYVRRLMLVELMSGGGWCHTVRTSSRDGELHAELTLFDHSGKLIAKVDGLVLRKVARQALLRDGDERRDDIRHQLVWRAAGPHRQLPTAARGTWLLFADRGHVAEALVEMLADRGEACRVVHHRIEPRRAAGAAAEETGVFVQALEDAGRAAPGGLTGVLFLAALDPDADALHAAPRRCCEVLALVKALAAVRSTHAPRLVLATRGAQYVSDDDGPADVGGAALWGLGRVIATEHPELDCRLIDLPPAARDTERDAMALLHEVLDGDGETQLALRAGERHVPRLSALAARARRAARGELRSDATYLVTGGLGGVGLHVARWIFDMGGRRIALLGRSEPSGSSAPALAQLRDAGARVLTCRADVTSRADLAGALARIELELAPVAGVIHAAGVLDDGILVHQSPERLRAVMAPKLTGAWNLHLLTRDLELEHFVLFSSLAAIVGTAGQGPYAAANAALDALAHHRRALGLPAVSINWGPWLDVGMAGSLDARDRGRLASAGIEALTPAQALLALRDAVHDAQPQVALFRYAPSGASHLEMSRRASVLEELGAIEGAADRAMAPAQQMHPRPDTLEAYQAPRSAIERALVGIWEELFAIEPIGVNDNFFELGGDSILGLKITAKAREHGIRLGESELFSHPTVAELAGVAKATATSAQREPQRHGPMGAASLEQGAGQSLTATDFPDADLSQEDLDRLLERLAHRSSPQDANAPGRSLVSVPNAMQSTRGGE